MTYSISKAIQDIEKIMVNLESPDADVRRNAAAWAQYVFCGNPGNERGGRLLELVGSKIELKVNGHAEPVEPDEYVRERCADCLRLARLGGFDISKFVPALKLASERDPVDWVRERALDALPSNVRKEELKEHPDELPLPKAWTTRPQPPAAPAKEKQLRA